MPARLTDDLIQPFQIETLLAEGRLVRLGRAVEAVLGAHHYPAPVARLLGECLTMAAVLAGGMKYDGVLTLQLKGDGPVRILVADVTSDGAVRGYAQFDQARLDQAELEPAQLEPAQLEPAGAGPVPRLLGAGHLALTVDQGPETERYQGLVALEGATLADCAHTYLRASVQLDAAVKLAVGRVPDGSGGLAWRAGGLMVQRLASVDRQLLSGEALDDDQEVSWRRAVILMGTTTEDELLDPGLHPHRLLYRLFNQDRVRVFEPAPLAMACRCSEARVEHVLRSFPRAEIETMKVDNKVIVTCEFCNATYEFDAHRLEGLYTT
jgi:molecular chaperone Hsp33